MDGIGQGLQQIVEIWLLLVWLAMHCYSLFLAPAVRHRQNESNDRAVIWKLNTCSPDLVAKLPVSQDCRAHFPFVRLCHSWLGDWRYLV